ncbi:hypothetical protein GCM10009602_70350 [Nocardiopsis tropica]|jgi:geranylgeranyl diphosphate synthase type I|uniref:Uncharacterized protein n=1 Tax=Nocardiopsis metallicus TaxID=179819 RepID=A0A840WSW4_9ACTN|nr:hypothetical protein [Nocardiopsis metallicus]
MLSREWRPFDAMRTEVMAGQYLDTLEQAQGTATREAALRYKPAQYTVERPLGLGATLVGDGSSSMALSSSRTVRAPVRT